MKSLVTACALVAIIGSLGLISSHGDSAVPTGTQEDSQKSSDGAKSESTAQEQAVPKNRNRWMQAKRRHSEQIFSALTEGDFEQMELSGRRMLVAGVIEKWFAENPLKDDVEYRAQLKAFDAATRDFVKEAEDEDLDEAFEAYVRMSRACVECHHLMRNAE